MTRKIVIDGTQKCTKCNIFKPFVEFYKSKRSSTGYDIYCRECKIYMAKLEYQRNIETYRRYNKTEKSILSRKTYTQKPYYKLKQFDSHLKYKFGIDYKKYEEMYKDQNGVCAICKRLNLNGKRLCVDHHWKSRQVRSLLCDVCNTTIGKIEENIEWLDEIKKYIIKWDQIISINFK